MTRSGLSPILRLAANLALSAASAAVVLLVLEGALRGIHYQPSVYRQPDRVANGRRTLLLDCYPTNPRRYFDIDLRDAAARDRYRGMGVARVNFMVPRTPFAVERRYNSLGFRGDEIPPKKGGTLRVAVMGDSFTEGMGVKEEDTYPRVLGRTLAADRLEVLNCGRRGYDFPALFDLLEDVLRLDPDVVVYGMVLNDPDRSQVLDTLDKSLDDWIRERRGTVLEGPLPQPGLFDLRLSAFVQDRFRRWRMGRDSTRWYRDLYGAANREGWQRTQELLREMNRRMGERGGRLLIALWPLFVDLERAYPFEDLEATITHFCLTAGIRIHPLRPAFDGHTSESLWVHPVDHHPNEVAHRLAAESLAPVVRSLASSRP